MKHISIENSNIWLIKEFLNNWVLYKLLNFNNQQLMKIIDNSRDENILLFVKEEIKTIFNISNHYMNKEFLICWF